jgi:hypothetical protein
MITKLNRNGMWKTKLIQFHLETEYKEDINNNIVDITVIQTIKKIQRILVYNVLHWLVSK